MKVSERDEEDHIRASTARARRGSCFGNHEHRYRPSRRSDYTSTMLYRVPTKDLHKGNQERSRLSSDFQRTHTHPTKLVLALLARHMAVRHRQLETERHPVSRVGLTCTRRSSRSCSDSDYTPSYCSLSNWPSRCRLCTSSATAQQPHTPLAGDRSRPGNQNRTDVPSQR